MKFIQALALVRLLRTKNQGVVWYKEVGNTSKYVVFIENETTKKKYISPDIFVYERIAHPVTIG
jgi:hypothetical protein